MPVFMGFGSFLGFAVAAYAAFAMKSDIQLGIAVTGFFAGLILWGAAVIIGRLDSLEGYAHEQHLREERKN